MKWQYVSLVNLKRIIKSSIKLLKETSLSSKELNFINYIVISICCQLIVYTSQ